MTEQQAQQSEQKAPKRFMSYDDFLKEFYPNRMEQEEREKMENDEEFGTELAIASLKKHGGVLRLAE